MTPYRLEFTLPGLPRMTNPSGRRTHWAVRMKESTHWKWMVIHKVGVLAPKKPLKRAKLTLTRMSAVSPDPDGLISGFKSIIDGLVMAAVLVNDRFENIAMPDYRWEKAPPKKGAIRVLVEEVIE